jgi:hypothetical protein
MQTANTAPIPPAIDDSNFGFVPDAVDYADLVDNDDDGVPDSVDLPSFRHRDPGASLASAASSLLRGKVPYGVGSDAVGWLGNTLIQKQSTLNSIKVIKTDDFNPVAAARALDIETGRMWRSWEPETIWEHLGVPDKDEATLIKDKIHAAQVILTNPDVFTDWHLFCAVSSALNHRRANFHWLDKPSFLEAAWTCEVLRRLAPTRSFGPGVIKFLVALMIEDGLYLFPWTGGDGLALSDPAASTAVGIARVDAEMCGKLRHLWHAGDIKTVKPGDIDEEDAFQVQLAKLVAAQEYLRAQKPDEPSKYESEKRK